MPTSSWWQAWCSNPEGAFCQILFQGVGAMDKTGDEGKTKAQLIEELQALRRQLAELRL